jgi:Family of unknown function (DUF5360)
MNAMPPVLKHTLSLIDIGMILYWSVSFFALIGLFQLPPSAMYDGYGTPVIDAWNWSFAPLDICFRSSGCSALALQNAAMRVGERLQSSHSHSHFVLG